MCKPATWAERLRALRLEVQATYLALWDARTPWPAKVLAAIVVAYALSPIDLIPDPIPVLGYLDDLVLIPLGIALVRRMIPAEVLGDCRRRAAIDGRRATVLPWVGASVVALVWLAALAGLAYALWRVLQGA